jgi:geranylgeranyl pyrophosphate synthase
LQVIPFLQIVQDELQLVEGKMRAAVPGQYPLLTSAVDHLLRSGGKRLRPALVILAAKFTPPELAGEMEGLREKTIALAAGWELLHTATLVHDDFIDNATTRRGNPTLNVTWPNSATVLAGDFLFARSAALSAETRNVEVMTIFANTLTVICNGELRQIFSERDRLPTMEEYYQRIYAKTSSLFAAAAQTGALLAAVPAAGVQALRDYGYNLGMAFQIVDDVLDYVGDEARLGKPLGSDLRQGVVTLPALRFVESGGDAGRVIRAANNGRSVQTSEVSETSEVYSNDDEIKALIAEIRDSGAAEDALAQAQEFAQEAQQALTVLPANLYRQALHELAGFVAERQA